MIKEIIFDCFGVLTEDGWLAFLRLYDNGEHSEELRYANHQCDSGVISYQDFLEEACRLTGADKATADSMIAGNHHINTLLLEYAEQLKSRGFSLGVISNVGSSLDTFLPGADLTVFDNMTLSFEAGVAKPDSLIFQAHLEKSGFRPEEVIFVDDREVNLEGANMIGMNTLLYKDFESTKKAIENLIKR